jgi:uncharacterized protein
VLKMFQHILQVCFVVACILGLLFYEDIKEVQLVTEQGEFNLKLEQANTPLARNLGLMWRRYLPENGGMLFTFNQEAQQSFWMKNTLIPLDIIFLNSSYQVVKIHKNAQPHDITRIPSEKPSQYVIELAGGSAEKFGFSEGDKVIIKNKKYL